MGALEQKEIEVKKEIDKLVKQFGRDIETTRNKYKLNNLLLQNKLKEIENSNYNIDPNKS